MMRSRLSVEWTFIALFGVVMVISGREIVLAHMGVPVSSLSTKYGCFALSTFQISMIANQMRLKSRKGAQ